MLNNTPRKPYPGYIVKSGAGNTWMILDYCMLYLAGGEEFGEKPEICRDNIYDKTEADKIALRLNIEWWDELSNIMEQLSQDRGDPKDVFKDESDFDGLEF